jgi:hypothetical protein
MSTCFHTSRTYHIVTICWSDRQRVI